ncbi:hypothetical protein F2P81_018406 [Scophthalmus maximus]|uniref:RRM domain-containing protein n=1 Tax=Scophthalmus maximus TaxID=52904 RepID=A0A6A4SDV6_SCOMX|nr:hypothetical protein F2P81_018406 [Scophthalmus maximus]
MKAWAAYLTKDGDVQRRDGIYGYGHARLEYQHEADDTGEENYEIDNHFCGYPRLPEDLSSGRRFGGNPSGSSRAVYQPPNPYYSSAGVNVQAKESDAERNARLLEEMEKGKEKAEKKQMKKQNQKRKKQLEKEKQNPVKNEEEKKDLQQSKVEDSKPVDEKSKNDTSLCVKKSTSAKDTGSSEQESSDEDSDAESDSFESEGLDMTSTFVTKAALIAKRKLEQKPKPECKEKKKSPVKECKTVPDKPNEEPELEKKDSAAPSVPTFEDNRKICTELAVIGNRFASSGDFNMAVKYFTDAIKYNPTEFKLFGNRSFCFEKMQEYEKALTDAELCVNMCPGWVKGLFRKGRALAGLKRYEEAAQSFSEVLKLDGSYSEAAQELMRVQITQLMGYGFTREQSSNALIIHGSVAKALEVLSKLHHRPAIVSLHRELFPVWVGNLLYPVPEAVITDLFSEAGVVYSVKVLAYKRCAFVNFTKQEYCDEAIRRFHGFELNGMKIAVRYPDRIPRNMGIARSALKAEDLHFENVRYSTLDFKAFFLVDAFEFSIHFNYGKVIDLSTSDSQKKLKTRNEKEL